MRIDISMNFEFQLYSQVVIIMTIIYNFLNAKRNI